METAAAPRLTSLSHGAGCACKIGPGELGEILERLPRSADPALLVGSETRDDAGAFLISEDIALVQTVDFFTPIVDDPYDFGRVAATNALSDLYAMGARPVTALNLVAFPLETLGAQVLADILRGGADVAGAAGVSIVGGHSIDDPEPKYGMAVTGVAHPDRLVRNRTAAPGDVLFLTKPIGSGAITTAAKRGAAPPDAVRACIEMMTTLNAEASRAAVAGDAGAMTDVTGFGLLGHLHELAAASGLHACIEAAAVPLLPGALAMMEGGAQSGGSRRNQEWVAPRVAYAPTVPDPLRALLSDAMTSGGLLIAIAEEKAGLLEEALREAAPATARIGQLEEGAAGTIEVL